MKHGPTAKRSSEAQVEFKPGESTETALAEKEEKRKKEAERTKDFTDADHAEDLLDSVIKVHNPYSETLKIKPNGKLDKLTRVDGKTVYLSYGDTAADLYKIAAEIEKKHPEYHFNFETDPEGKWIKYTVSKDTN